MKEENKCCKDPQLNLKLPHDRILKWRLGMADTTENTVPLILSNCHLLCNSKNRTASSLHNRSIVTILSNLKYDQKKSTKIHIGLKELHFR